MTVRALRTRARITARLMGIAPSIGSSVSNGRDGLLVPLSGTRVSGPGQPTPSSFVWEARGLTTPRSGRMVQLVPGWERGRHEQGPDRRDRLADARRERRARADGRP